MTPPTTESHGHGLGPPIAHHPRPLSPPPNPCWHAMVRHAARPARTVVRRPHTSESRAPGARARGSYSVVSGALSQTTHRRGITGRGHAPPRVPPQLPPPGWALPAAVCPSASMSTITDATAVWSLSLPSSSASQKAFTTSPNATGDAGALPAPLEAHTELQTCTSDPTLSTCCRPRQLQLPRSAAACPPPAPLALLCPLPRSQPRTAPSARRDEVPSAPPGLPPAEAAEWPEGAGGVRVGRRRRAMRRLSRRSRQRFRVRAMANAMRSRYFPG